LSTSAFAIHSIKSFTSTHPQAIFRTAIISFSVIGSARRLFISLTLMLIWLF
jgi:hypothetical protein